MTPLFSPVKWLPVAILCLGLTSLHAQITYPQSSCEFAPMPTAGTELCLGDDVVSSAIPLGFTFSFYGTAFTNCYVSSNGFLTFTPGLPSGCCGGFALPNATYPYSIFFCQQDLNPNGCAYGDITYYTSGGAGTPHVFVLSFTAVPHFPGPTNFPVTVQLQLHESGEIRIVSTDIPNSGSTQTMGLNMNGAVADVVPGRNASMWSAENECISFGGEPGCYAATPTGLYADNITSVKAKLHWAAVAGVDKYTVSVYTAGGTPVSSKNTSLNSLTIKDLTPGTNYYFKVRTVCVDEGTTSAWSAPVYFTTLMRSGMTEATVDLFPNPNNGTFQLNIDAPEAATYSVQVLNNTGQIVYSKYIEKAAGESTLSIDLGDISAGMYFLQLSDAGGQTSFPIVVNK